MTTEQLEERMGTVIMQLAERQRQIRLARQAEEEVTRLRAELLELAQEYAAQDDPPVLPRILGARRG